MDFKSLNPIKISMKRISTFLFLCLIVSDFNLSAAVVNKPLATIHIKNTSALERKDEIVEVKFSDLSSKVKGRSFRLIEAVSRKEMSYQLEYKGMDKPQNLLLQINGLKPDHEIVFEVLEGEPAKSDVRTFARYVPERKDDFAWENDRVAFRMYGKALETAPDNAYGTDIWSKRTNKLILNDWYKLNDYHNDKGEGMDYYQVGLTLGAGDIAPYLNDSIYFSKNYHHYKILDNGPLRSTFQLGYDSWEVGNMAITATKTISLSAGSQMNRIEVNYIIQGANETDVVQGIIKRKDPGTILLDEKNGILGYWEPEISGKGIMGIGILANNVKEMKVAHGQLLSRSTIKSNVPLVYYNGGTWNRSGNIRTADEWFGYLANYKYCLDNPLKAEVL